MINEKAFTLIELLVVVAIIGILSAISIAIFDEYKNKAHDANAKRIVADLYTMVDAWVSSEWDGETASSTIYYAWVQWGNNTDQFWGRGSEFPDFYSGNAYTDDFYFVARVDVDCFLGIACTGGLVQYACAAHCPSASGNTVRRYCKIGYEDGTFQDQYDEPTKATVNCP